MLSYINIKDFALVNELELDLQPGMTVLSGETGAGKSIIIDTVEFALGAKADTACIHTAADRCEVTVVFDVADNPKAKQWLIDQELDSEDECIIRRILNRDGRSKSSINGHSTTQQTIRALNEFLIDIHGQHEHQALLNAERQRELLDAFADAKDLSKQTKNLYFTWLKAKKDLIEMQSIAENYPTKIEYLNHQLKELAQLNFDLAELEQLRTEQQHLNSTEELVQAVNTVLNLLTENPDGATLANLINAKTTIEKYHKFSPKMQNILELLNNAIIHTSEAITELEREVAAVELNQDRLATVENQLTLIYDLSRKHHVKPEELPQVRANIEEQLKRLENSTVEYQKLEATIKNLETEYLTIATELSNKRQAAALQLNQLITMKMQALGMQGGVFLIQLEPNYKQSFSSGGLERVEFLVSANPGQPLHPLTKVASGGELSRISLAIQVEIATKDITPTLIFDEVDTGIGGKIAEIVGRSLRQLGDATQVICVTHLPQVAVQGHHHIVVTKTATKNHTKIALTTLSKQERLQEIARMLGGVNVTKQALAHAQEMLAAVI